MMFDIMNASAIFGEERKMKTMCIRNECRRKEDTREDFLSVGGGTASSSKNVN